MACTNHADRESISRCVVCGAELCQDCSREVGGRFYCPAHAAAAPPAPAPAATAAAPPAVPAPTTGADDAQQDNPSLAALAYILPAVLPLAGLLLAVIVLATEMKRSRYMRFHALHAIFVNVGYLVVLAAARLVTAVLHHMPLVGGLVSWLIWIVIGAGWLVLSVILGVNAYNRKTVTIPLVTQMANDQADRMKVV